jgi:AraC-like DNA-binding protein
MDPLSDILSLLKPRNYMSAGFDAAGPWAIRFANQANTIKCGTVVSGQCYVSVEDLAGPVLLTSGNSFVLPRGRTFFLASDPECPPVDAPLVFAKAQSGGIVQHNGGGECFIVSSRFVLSGPHADLLLASLPPIVRIESDQNESSLRWLVERMMQELSNPQPGGFLVLQHLAHTVLVQALRLHLSNAQQASGQSDRTGQNVPDIPDWFAALSDKQIATAIACIHGDPAHPWTLKELARHAGMSRSAFAARFRDVVAVPPMAYLTRWRMLLAGDRLTHSGLPISEIALSVGYESESAFSTAFKRVMGCAPRRFTKKTETSLKEVFIFP